MLISAIQQHESVIIIYRSPLCWASLPSPHLTHVTCMINFSVFKYSLHDHLHLTFCPVALTHFTCFHDPWKEINRRKSVLWHIGPYSLPLFKHLVYRSLIFLLLTKISFTTKRFFAFSPEFFHLLVMRSFSYQVVSLWESDLKFVLEILSWHTSIMTSPHVPTLACSWHVCWFISYFWKGNGTLAFWKQNFDHILMWLQTINDSPLTLDLELGWPDIQFCHH